MKRVAPDLVLCVVLATTAFAIGFPRHLDGFYAGDEGLLSYGALRVLEGDVPNRGHRNCP